MNVQRSATIAALATAPVPAGVAVIRISGPNTKKAVQALFRSPTSPLSEPRKLILGDVIDHDTGQVIDRALAVFMPNPLSYTGEDVAEFQLHGSMLITDKILRSLFRFGISPAEPGEFTKRAFLNGKLDLVQAEAVCDVIHASSERSLQVASEHLKGRFSEALEEIGEPLRNTLAQLEASIDFPEEEIEPETLPKIRKDLRKSCTWIETLLNTYSYGAAIREGYRVLLCGAPNAGKSSLLNLFVGRKRAIVSDTQGTTRDLIEEQVILAGHPFVFCDSAGIQDTQDQVERIGIELAKEKVDWADLVLFLVDSTDDSEAWRDISKEIRSRGKNVWLVVNKIDLNPSAIGQVYCDSTVCAQNFYLSAKTGDGLESLKEALLEECRTGVSHTAESSQVITNARHQDCLQRANEALLSAVDAIDQDQPLEIVAGELRIALNALEEIVGKTYTEDILGRIFSQFCIGK